MCVVFDAACRLLGEIREVHRDHTIDEVDVSVSRQNYNWGYHVRKGPWNPLWLPLAKRLSYPVRDGLSETKVPIMKDKVSLLPPVLWRLGSRGFGLGRGQLNLWLNPKLLGSVGGDVYTPGAICETAYLIADMLCRDGSYEADLDAWSRTRGHSFNKIATAEYCRINHQISTRPIQTDFSEWLCNALIGTVDFEGLKKLRMNGLSCGLACLHAQHDGEQLLIRNVALCGCSSCKAKGTTPVNLDGTCGRSSRATIRMAVTERMVNVNGVKKKKIFRWINRALILASEEVKAKVMECPICKHLSLVDEGLLVTKEKRTKRNKTQVHELEDAKAYLGITEVDYTRLQAEIANLMEIHGLKTKIALKRFLVANKMGDSQKLAMYHFAIFKKRVVDLDGERSYPIGLRCPNPDCDFFSSLEKPFWVLRMTASVRKRRIHEPLHDLGENNKDYPYYE